MALRARLRVSAVGLCALAHRRHCREVGKDDRREEYAETLHASKFMWTRTNQSMQSAFDRCAVCVRFSKIRSLSKVAFVCEGIVFSDA